MKRFTHLIEFITEDNRHFYNKDIKCPVCGEVMWCDSIHTVSNGQSDLNVVCPHECCTMNIKIKDKVLWDDKI